MLKYCLFLGKLSVLVSEIADLLLLRSDLLVEVANVIVFLFKFILVPEDLFAELTHFLL